MQKITLQYNVAPYHAGEGVSVTDGLASLLVQRGVATYVLAPLGAAIAHPTLDAAHSAAAGAQDIALVMGGQSNLVFNAAHRRI